MKSKYGCYLILPLKYAAKGLEQRRLEEECPRQTLTTMDLNENIKNMFNGEGQTTVGTVRRLSRRQICRWISGEEALAGCRVTEGEKACDFDFLDSYLYVFHTQTAFLALGLRYDQVEAVNTIICPGFAENSAVYDWIDGEGKTKRFCLEECLSQLWEHYGFQKFFDGPSAAVPEAYAYLLAVTDAYFPTLETIRKVSFNLHRMLPLDTQTQDDSEEDIRYVYAVKNPELDAYRWGCCVTSQTLAYVIAEPTLDVAREMAQQAEDGLPGVLLALYEKYTCLRFTQLLSELDSKGAKQIKSLKGLMLRFRAFGTVTPANLSRWNNVKQIYGYLLEVHDTATAVADIETKLNILSEHQQALEQSRNETVINLITVFGIISILASVISIVQILLEGDPVIWISTVLTSISIAAVFVVALLLRKK